MRSWHWLVLGVLLCLCACSGDKPSNNGYGKACAGGPSEGGCGTACKNNSSACAAGLYCASDGFCHADCSIEREILCDNGLVCVSNGYCVDYGTPDDDGGVCGNVKITGKNAKPNVMLIVDQSSSMDADFGDGANPPSRWNVLRDLLIGRSGDRPAGLVYDLQDQVQFGFVVYSARAVGDSPVQQADTVCPMLNNPGSMNNEQSIISFALNNYTEISGFYGPAGMVDETPTGDAITLITDKIGTPSSYEDPVVFILATDGEPDRCEALNPNNNNPAAQNEAIDAVSSAYDLSIKTFVIAIGNEVSNTHAQAVAAAGQGISPVPPLTNELFYRPSGKDALEEALETIIRGERPCTFEIDGTIEDMDRVCEGSVRLFTEAEPEGRELACNDADGWGAVDADTIEIRGQACTDYRSSNQASVEGVFPCGIVDGGFVF